MLHKAFVAVDQTVSLRPSIGTVVTKTNLPAGTVAMVDEAMKVVGVMPTTGKVAFVYSVGNSKPLIKTQFIDVTKMTVTSHKHVSSTEQVTIVGYQGGADTNNMPVVNSTDFGIYIRQEQEDHMFGGNNSYWLPMTGQFTTSAASSVKEFAMLAADAIFASVSGWKQEITGNKPSYVKIEVISNGTAGAALGQTLTVSNGSKTVTSAVAGVPTALTGVAVGDLITIAGTVDTYEVATISGTTYTLTTKYRGADDAAAAVSEVTVAGTPRYGIKFTGIANEFDRIFYKNYTKNTFGVYIQRAGEPAGIFQTTTQVKEGVGVWEKVDIEEYSSLLADNQGTLVNFLPNQEPPRFTVNDGKYSIVDVKWEYPMTEAVVGFTGKTYGNVRFMLELDSSDNLVAGSQGDQLAETLLGTAFTTGGLDA
jgi:hypothetical protein